MKATAAEQVPGRYGPESGLAALISRLGDGLGKLLEQHLQLARLELSADARSLAAIGGRLALFLPLVLVGYGLISGALVVALLRVLPLELSLLVVGGGNLLLGGVGGWRAARGLKERSLLEGSLAELHSSAALFAPEASAGTEPSR
jgi:uncharacterized membrane protein YqjE